MSNTSSAMPLYHGSLEIVEKLQTLQANRLLQDGYAKSINTALNMVYTSPVYAKSEQEETKYWWLGLNAFYQAITMQ